MNEQDIINFSNSIKDFSLEQLKQKRIEIQNAISKMILDNDLIIKAAIIENLIKEKQNG